ncbi:hypothetical protein MPSEU_000209100 [Mayamaea pseudoterrestris]|nr:hypothetical protein MPSEU_000209100 [Mayamaea pseudoterrestris]
MESIDRSFLLSTAHVQERILESSPLWTARTDNNNNVLTIARSFIARNFQAALDCINAMGAIAEEANHHPDFHLTNYRHVEVVIYTHKLNGITENDLALARAIDERVKIDYSAKWLGEHPEASHTAK